MKNITIEDARRLVTYLVGPDGDVEDALERAKMLENDRINHEALIKLYTSMTAALLCPCSESGMHRCIRCDSEVE